MESISETGFRMNLFGECDLTDPNRYNFLFNFRDPDFNLRLVIFVDSTCSEANDKKLRMSEICENYKFRNGNQWNKINSKELFSSDFDLIESYVKTNYGYVLMTSEQNTILRSPI